MIVRLAQATDAEAIRAIYNLEVLKSTVTFDLVPRTHDDQRAWLASHSGAHPAVVAVDGDQILGFGSLSPYKDRAAYSTTVEDSVYVHRDWRGKGVGRLILEPLLHVVGNLVRRAADDRVTARHGLQIELADGEIVAPRHLGEQSQPGVAANRFRDVG